MITITEKASTYIQSFIDNSVAGVGLRLSVKGAGCSGFMYDFQITDHVDENDIVFEQHDVKVIVSKLDLPYLDGTEITYVEDKMSKGLGFINPNSTGSCGCGDSFTI